MDILEGHGNTVSNPNFGSLRIKSNPTSPDAPHDSDVINEYTLVNQLKNQITEFHKKYYLRGLKYLQVLVPFWIERDFW